MNSIEKLWYQNNLLTKALLPIAWLFCSLAIIRKLLYSLRLLPSKRLPVPVIVIGNITVGGTGKTPLVIWLAAKLREEGLNPGIVSRGYRGKARHWPQQVRPDSDPVIVGDEPVLLARRTGCPMAVGPDRVEAARQLLAHSDCNIIISDDGLQHYRLRRDVEVAVIDSQRGLGNGYCLPAGPLREPKLRLKRLDFIVENNLKKPSGNNISMYLEGDTLINLRDKNQTMKLDKLKGKCVHGVAGIGNPQRFFKQLEAAGIKVTPHAFPDHHYYQPDDLHLDDKAVVVMTEKDAVKLERYAGNNYWYLPVEAKVQRGFKNSIMSKLKVSNNG